jgi:DNA (cytosine-5)-methyltransferase 1
LGEKSSNILPNVKNEIIAVDFFCSIGGMTYGFRKAGIKVIAGIDIDPSCKDTYEYNNPGSKFIEADVKNYTFDMLKDATGIKEEDDNLVFIGCSPCQYWSIIKTDKTKSQETKNLLSEFQKFVEHFKPGYVVVENVPGILKKSDISKLDEFKKMLRDNKYEIDCNILNANHFGVPQHRRRFVLVASRVNKTIKLPEPQLKNLPVVSGFIGAKNGFKKINAGTTDGTNFVHTTARLSEKNLQRIKRTSKNGGNRLEWKNDPDLQLECYKGNDHKFNDIYSRMSWDKPAPTITTKFHSISNGRFGHPEEDRAISLREGATLQTFPKRYRFIEKSMGKIAKHIGNAVPPELAKRIAVEITKKN